MSACLFMGKQIVFSAGFFRSVMTSCDFAHTDLLQSLGASLSSPIQWPRPPVTLPALSAMRIREGTGHSQQ